MPLSNLAIAAWLAAMGAPSANAADVGAAGGPLLQESFGARPTALGQAYVGLSNDIFGMAFNPAGLSQLERAQAAVEYSNEIVNERVGFIGLAMPLTHSQTLGLSYSFLDSGRTDIYDSLGNVTGNVTGQSEQLLHFGYGYAWNRLPYSLPGTFHAGFGVKYLRSALAEQTNAQAAAFDGGLLYTRQMHASGLGSLGLSVTNWGSGLRYTGGKATGGATDPLPLTYRLGASYQKFLLNRDYLTATVELDRNAPESSNAVAAGAEYLYRDLLAVRLGYRREVTSAIFSFGVGLSWRDLNLDYAISLLDTFGPQNKVSLTYSFNIPWVEPRSRASSDVLAYRTQKMIADGQYFNAMESVLKRMELSPDDALAQEQKGKIRSWVESIIKAGAANVKFDYASAHQAFFQGSWEKAAQWLGEALNREPDNAEVKKYLSIAKSRAEEKTKLHRLRAGARISYLYELAERAYLAKDYPKALNILSEILRISQYEPAVKLATEVKNAQKTARKQLPPKTAPQTEKAMAIFFSAVRNYSEGKLPEALSLLQSALKLDPENQDISKTIKQVEEDLRKTREEDAKQTEK